MPGSGRLRLRALRPAGVRSVRLASGLVLFAYVGTHLLNHSLGNASLAWLERGLQVQKLIWQGWPGTLVLYSALTVHFCLGLWALYERRALHWRPSEVAQLTLGLCIPPLLANHLVNTRIAFAAFGLDKGYAQLLYSLWIAQPAFGRVQLALLAVAWLHGCYGIHFWLQLKPWFGAWRSVLSSIAVLLPVLALLGYVQGGREVMALAQNPDWRAQALAQSVIGTAAQDRWLVDLRNDFLLFDGGALLLVLSARGARSLWERRRGRICVRYPDGRQVQVPPGFSVLEASRIAGIPHASACGGRARCSLCRVRVIGDVKLPPPREAERRVLARLGADPRYVRLACQLRPKSDLDVWPLVPPAASSAFEQGRRWRAMPKERFGVFMFVDMRDSTRLAAEELPFDSLFLVSRFLAAACAAIVQEGGLPNQFLGDGILAIFGLATEPATACRQALAAVPRIAINIAALNEAMASQLRRPIRFGIGVHCGRTVMGEIGFREHVTFTALGDALNVASRLQALTRDVGCEAIVSDAVFRHAGIPAGGLTPLDARLRGRDETVPVRLLPDARQMPCPDA